ncbi:hypothetical protein ACU8L5_33660 (plasmid) [Rhizobium leguminosarum]|jgi:hypothetical protein
MGKNYREVPGHYPEKLPELREGEFRGNGWLVSKMDGTYRLSYISGELAGQEKEIMVEEEDYEGLVSGKMTLDDICIKYGVH